MKAISKVVGLLTVISAFALAQSQTQTTAPAVTVVPRLVSFSGIVKGGSGKPISGQVSITFALYAEQQGGTPLWSEMQAVQADTEGRYSVFLGAANGSGLPLEVFTSGTARWLAVRPDVPGVEDPARILLVGVPYALKAADADTLGGKPASAFVTTESQVTPAVVTGAAVAPAAQGVTADANPTGNGTTDYIPIWTSSSNLGNSILYQSGNNIGIGTTTPGSPLTLSSLGNTFPSGISYLANFVASGAGNGAGTSDYRGVEFEITAAESNGIAGFSWQGRYRDRDPRRQSGSKWDGEVRRLGDVCRWSDRLRKCDHQRRIDIGSGAGYRAFASDIHYAGGESECELFGRIDVGAFAQLAAANTFGGTQEIIGNLNVTGLFNGSLYLQPSVVDYLGYYTGANVIAGYEAGLLNTVQGGVTCATISGGGGAFIGGGTSDINFPNSVTDDFGTVAGGSGNTAGKGDGTGQFATVSGGRGNTASGELATVSGGSGNTASGEFATAAGGAGNLASGISSFAAGNAAYAEDAGSFVWCQTNGNAGCPSQGTNSFVVETYGPIYFYDGPNNSGCYLSAGSGRWTPATAT